MKKSFKLLTLLAVAMLIATTAFAASPWTQADTYADKVRGKLDFGMKNLLGGWTAIFPCSNGCKMKSDNGGCPSVCCVKNMGMGIVNAITYTVGGALHVVTFPIPVDVPLPGDGVQL